MRITYLWQSFWKVLFRECTYCVAYVNENYEIGNPYSFRCTKKPDDGGDVDDRRPYDSGYGNRLHDTFANLDKFSRKSSRGNGNRANLGGSARSATVQWMLDRSLESQLLCLISSFLSVVLSSLCVVRRVLYLWLINNYYDQSDPLWGTKGLLHPNITWITWSLNNSGQVDIGAAGAQVPDARREHLFDAGPRAVFRYRETDQVPWNSLC